MPTLNTQALGPTEMQVMTIIWSHRRSLTVRDLHTALAHRGIAYTTVMTTMDRLAEKGVLSQSAERKGLGGAYRYTAAISRGELLAGAVEQLCAQLDADRGDRAFALRALLGPSRLH